MAEDRERTFIVDLADADTTDSGIYTWDIVQDLVYGGCSGRAFRPCPQRSQLRITPQSLYRPRSPRRPTTFGKQDYRDSCWRAEATICLSCSDAWWPLRFSGCFRKVLPRSPRHTGALLGHCSPGKLHLHPRQSATLRYSLPCATDSPWNHRQGAIKAGCTCASSQGHPC